MKSKQQKTFTFVGTTPNVALKEKNEQWVKFTIKALLSHFGRDVEKSVTILSDGSDSVGLMAKYEAKHLEAHRGNIHADSIVPWDLVKALGASDGVVVVLDPEVDIDETSLQETYAGKQVLVISPADEKLFTL